MLRAGVGVSCAGLLLLLGLTSCQAQTADTGNGKDLKSLVHSASPGVDVSVYSVVFSADTTIKFYDLKTGRDARTFTPPPPNTIN
jgi:hypothetical protein